MQRILTTALISILLMFIVNSVKGQHFPITTDKTLICKNELVNLTVSSPLGTWTWTIMALDGQSAPVLNVDYTCLKNTLFEYSITNLKLEGRYKISRDFNFIMGGPYHDEIILRFVTDLAGANFTNDPAPVCSDQQSQVFRTIGTYANASHIDITPANSYTSVSHTINPTTIIWNRSFGGTATLTLTPSYWANDGKRCYGAPKTKNVVIQKVPNKASTPTIAEAKVCQGTLTTEVSTAAIGATSYEWEPVLIPSTAGTVTGSGSTGTIHWNVNWSGTAQVRARGIGCGPGDWSDYKTITVTAKPGQATTPTGPSIVYNGNLNVKYTSTCSGATSLNYILVPSEAGTITPASGYVNFDKNWVGTATIYAEGVTCAAGVRSIGKIVTVNPLPSTPNKPTGVTPICYGTSQSTFSIATVVGATSYLWEVTPSTAGTVPGNGQTITVNWAIGQSGIRTIRVRGVVEGNLGPWSDPLTVEILPQVGVAAKPTGSNINFCQGTVSTSYSTTGAINATSYQWELLPEGIGNISQTGNTSATITWNTSQSGTALLKVRGSNCTPGAWSPELAITINALPTIPTKPTGLIDVCQGTISTVYVTGQVPNATSYNWVIEPTSAATIIGGTTQSTVYWSSSFAGVAKIKVRGQSCGFGEYSEVLDVLVKATPQKASTPSGNIDICQGTEVSYYTTSGAENAESYIWEIFPTTAGNLMQDGLSCAVSWSANHTGSAMLKVKGVSCADGSWSNNLSIIVRPLPLKPTRPSGPASVCQGATNKTYSTTVTQNATSYQWLIMPESAGTITGTGTTATVNFNADFIDGASIIVRGQSCNYGSWSDEYPITVNPRPGEISNVQAPLDLCQGVDNINVTSTNSEFASQYNWSIVPTNAGTITGVNPNATLNLNDSYSGNVTLSVQAQNSCGVSSIKSAVTNVIAKPLAAAIPVGDINICQGTEFSDYNTEGALNASQYQWQLSNEVAGTLVPNATSCKINWNPTFTGNVSLRVKGISCAEGVYSPYLNITVHSKPTVPNTPTGISMVCLPSENSIFTVNQTNGNSLLWAIEPTNAGSISGNGTTATVVWNAQEESTANITVATVKEYCNNSDASNAKAVTLRPKPTVTGGEYDSIFVDQPSFTIDKGKPVGGAYFLNSSELIGATFNPDNAGLGVHNVEYRYTENSCSNSAIVRISVYNFDTNLKIKKSDVCLNADNILLSGGEPDGGNYSGKGVVGGIFYPSIAGVATHIITYSVTKGNHSNSDWDTIVVLAAPEKPIIASDKEIYCKGSTANLSLTGEGGKYKWYIGETLINEGNTAQVKKIQENFTVNAYEENLLKCLSEAREFEVQVDQVEAGFAANKTSILPESKIEFSNLTVGAATYLWNFGDGTSSSTQENPNHYYYNLGNYSVSLIATSTNSCKDTLVKTGYINVSNSPTSIQETSVLGLNVYPNPAEDVVYIDASDYQNRDEIVIGILDITGRLMLNKSITNEGVNAIDVIKLLPGTYFITISVNGITGRKTIIIE